MRGKITISAIVGIVLLLLLLVFFTGWVFKIPGLAGAIFGAGAKKLVEAAGWSTGWMGAIWRGIAERVRDALSFAASFIFIYYGVRPAAKPTWRITRAISRALRHPISALKRGISALRVLRHPISALRGGLRAILGKVFTRAALKAGLKSIATAAATFFIAFFVGLGVSAIFDYSGASNTIESTINGLTGPLSIGGIPISLGGAVNGAIQGAITMAISAAIINAIPGIGQIGYGVAIAIGAAVGFFLGLFGIT